MLRHFYRILCFCLIIFLFNLNSTYSYGDQTLDISLSCFNNYPVSGEEFTIYLNFSPSESLNISAYRLKVNFDSSKLAYKGLYSYVDNDDFKTYLDENNLTILYVTTEKGFNISSNSQQNILELNFKVLSSCDIGSTPISAVIDGLCNYNAEAIPLPEINPLIITVTQTGDGNCDLADLSTPEYKLIPKFSSEVTNYSVEVPYSKSTIEFIATPLDNDATVKVNRKTLKSAGTSTDINLTVLSSDKKSKKIYTVTVNRLSKENSGLETLKKLSNSDDEFYTDNNELYADSDEFYADNNELYSDNDESTRGDLNNNDEPLDENIIPTNIDIQNFSSPLVVKENAFNFILFLIVSIFFIFFSIFIIKHKK